MRLVLLLIFGASIAPCVAQPALSSKSKKAIELYTLADNYRVRGLYREAIELLDQAINKDKNFSEAYFRLAQVYKAQRVPSKAIENFQKSESLTTDARLKKSCWFELGESMLMEGNYKGAQQYLQNFLASETQNKRYIIQATAWLKNAEYALSNQSLSSQLQVKPMNDTVNRFPTQYFPVLTADQNEIIFTKRMGNSQNDDEDIVISRKDERGRWYSPTSISSKINSTLNEGTCTISADGRKLIFTSCVGRKGYGSCDLFESRKIGTEWTIPENLGPNVNSSEWDSQPTLSSDGRTLYFVSDRRGTLGMRDIFYSMLDDNGQWTKAKNLGAPVNTIFDEISPFIHVNNRQLYFATNGQPGFGGYDIFMSERLDSGWTKPENLGPPLNDHQDQYSLYITADGLKGYYSHEEMMPNGLQRSRLYEVVLPEKQQVKYKSNYVRGIVVNRATRAKLKARIELINLQKGTREGIIESDSVSGEYLMVLSQGADYGLYISKPGYLFKSLNFNYSEVADFDPIFIDIELDPIISGSKTVLNNIFFAFNSYQIDEKSRVELDKVVSFLTENQNVRVEIGGHTDNVGDEGYNLRLSENRAKSVIEYLKTKGISPNRLFFKGYGSKNPIFSNATPEGQAGNRRIEFSVL